MATSLEPIIKLDHLKNIKMSNTHTHTHTHTYIVDVDGLFYVCKMVEIHQFFFIVTSLIFILMSQKKRIRFIMIWKIKLKSFQINSILELFMCLMLELLKKL